mmetsp:Transcript_4659/g.7202  ORF Transcript_4659/g.7202 Transcript_4659/m.7202 type:complete len:251 (-) Transcript_4659:1369-2121(-)
MVELMTKHVYARCCPRRKSCTRKIEGHRRAKIHPVKLLGGREMIRKVPTILMDMEGMKMTAVVVVGGIIEEIDHIMAEEEGIIMTGGETIVVGETIMIVAVMDVEGTIIGTDAEEEEEAGEMKVGTTVEGGDIHMSVKSPPVIAAVDVRGVGASPDPPLAVEVEATPHLMDLDHQAVTRLGVIVEAIPGVSLVRPQWIHTTRRHKIKNANEATQQGMKRRNTVDPLQNPKLMLRMLSQKISALSSYLNSS